MWRRRLADIAENYVASLGDHDQLLLKLLGQEKFVELAKELDGVCTQPPVPLRPSRWDCQNIGVLFGAWLAPEVFHRRKILSINARRAVLFWWLASRLQGPHRPHYLFILRAVSRAKTDRLPDAIRDIEASSIQCDEVQLGKVCLLFLNREFEDAFQQLESIIRHSPNNDFLLALAANAAFSTRRFEAVDQFAQLYRARNKGFGTTISHLQLAALFAASDARFRMNKNGNELGRTLSSGYDEVDIKSAEILCYNNGYKDAAKALRSLRSEGGSMADEAHAIVLEYNATDHRKKNRDLELRIKTFVESVGIPQDLDLHYAQVLVTYIDYVAALRISHEDNNVTMRAIFHYLDRCGATPRLLILWRDMHFEKMEGMKKPYTGFMLLRQLHLLETLRDITAIPSMRWMIGHLSEIIFHRLIDASLGDIKSVQERQSVRFGMMLIAIRRLYGNRTERMPPVHGEENLSCEDAKALSMLKKNFSEADALVSEHLDSDHRGGVQDAISRLFGSARYLQAVETTRCGLLNQRIAIREARLDDLSRFALSHGLRIGHRGFGGGKDYNTKVIRPNRPACFLVSSESTTHLIFFDDKNRYCHQVFKGPKIRALCKALDEFRERLTVSRGQHAPQDVLIHAWARFMATGAPLMWQTYGKVIVELCRKSGIEELAVFSQYKGSIIPIHLASYAEGAKQRYLVEHLSVTYAPSIERTEEVDAGAAVTDRNHDIAVLVSDGLRSNFGCLEDDTLISLYQTGKKVGEILNPQGPKQIFDALRNSKVVHICCHGVWSAEPIDVQLALSNNGRLTVRDVLSGPQVNADLVIMASCDIGAVPTLAPSGQIWMPFALLEKGARQVIAPISSVWNDSTCTLMSRFHERLIDSNVGSAARTLASVQREFIQGAAGSGRSSESGMRGFHFVQESKRRSVSLSDPIAWGPFVHFSNF